MSLVFSRAVLYHASGRRQTKIADRKKKYVKSVFDDATGLDWIGNPDGVLLQAQMYGQPDAGVK
jgi:hypothetical protein